MSSEAQDAVAFLQDLMVGKLTYDRMDPKHLRQLGSACQLVDDYAVVTGLLPELSQKLAGLKAGEQEGEQALARRKKLLAEIGEAIAGRVEAIQAEIEAARAAAEEAEKSVADEKWVWGDAKAKPFDGVVAIDLGTTNVVCAHWNFQSMDPAVSSNEPVAVNVLDAAGFHRLQTGSYKVGTKALKQRNQINLYRSFRRWLGTQHKPRPAVTGSQLTPVAVADLVGAVVKEALQALTGQISPGGEPLRFPNVVVTVPASGDAAFEYELRQVFERLRIQGNAELDEATAAGVYALLKPVLQRQYAQGEEQLTPGKWYAKTYGMPFDGNQGEMDVLCIDFGGGTTDMSVVRFAVLEDSRACRLTVEVMESSGFQELSGEGLTLHVFDLLKRRLALALADPKRALSGVASEALAEHPQREFHEAEAGPAKAMYVPQHLAEDLAKLVEAWDQVAGHGPLDDDLRRVVDTLYPTSFAEAARVGKKVRRVNFQWLWDEAERIKRSINERRAGGEEGPVYERLKVRGARRQAKSVHLENHLKAGGLDPAKPAVEGALAVGAADIDAFVKAQGEGLLAEVRRIAVGRTLRRVLLAGNGANDARYALEDFLGELGIGPQIIELDRAHAKEQVAKGACLWAVGNRLEGVHVAILRRPRHPVSLKLVSALRSDDLFTQGELINRFSYVQPPVREGDEGTKLIQVDRVVGGKQGPFMMFRPNRDGQLLKSIDDLPIKKRQDVMLPDPDQFLLLEEKGFLCDFSAKEPHQYIQTAVEWISNWEVIEALRKEMSVEEVIAWLESREALQEDPPAGQAFHRYYMDETRELYLVYHARGKKLLVPGEVVESARKQMPARLDPFSGVH